jgi:DNA-binding LacI/PurR family transcriptional regulator
MAGYALARHGVNRLLLLAPDPRRGMRVMNLYTGVCQGYLQAGAMPPAIDSMFAQAWNPDEGRARVAEYLDRAGQLPPQAILADEDLIASSAAQACMARGLRIPEDVVVLGATGIESSAHCHPSLTVIRQPLGQLGRELGQTLLGMIDMRQFRVPGRKLACEMVSRESFPVPQATLDEIHGGIELCGQPIDPTWHHAMPSADVVEAPVASAIGGHEGGAAAGD